MKTQLIKVTDLFHQKLNIYKPNVYKCAIELATKLKTLFSNARNKILRRTEAIAILNFSVPPYKKYSVSNYLQEFTFAVFDPRSKKR